MRNFVLLLLIFVCSVRSARDHKTRTVNVALETSVLFEPKDIRSNLDLMNNVRSFLDKIYETLEPQAELTFRDTEDPKTLPDFLENVGLKLLNFSNDGIQYFANALRERIYSYTSQSRSSYHEFADPTLKKILKDTVEQFSDMDAEKLKRKLHKFIQSDKPVLRSFTKRLDKFYTKEDLSEFNKFVKKLDEYELQKKDPSNIVKEWLDFSIFNRVNKLNSTAKEKLVNTLTLLTDSFKGDKTRLRAEDESIDKSKEEDVSGSDGNRVHKHHIHSHKKETVGDKKKNGLNSKEKDPNGSKTEVIVDNVEFFIKTVQD